MKDKPVRREVITWNEVDRLIDHLLPQLEGTFDGMVMITRGGIIPGGMMAEALHLEQIFVASVDFPSQIEAEKKKLLAWPKFIQFPDDSQLRGRRMLVVDDVWGSGRTITAVKNRITGAAGVAVTCVLHFNPYRSLFGTLRPDYFAATTDAHIVYPWEIDRGPESVLLKDF